MDEWKYRDISYRDHVICNPLSSDKLDELVALLDLHPGAAVLDIGCGKGELLVRLAERYHIAGDGVDRSPYIVREARARAQARVQEAALTFHELDGRDFEAPAGSYDLAMCVGASWIFDGYRATLQALRRFVRPGGLVLVGEPFWRRAPESEYLHARGYTATSFATHAGNVVAGEELGLTPLYAMVSSEDDWDRYEALQWRATERYAAANPDDPDLAEIAQRQREHRALYLRWERDTMGWALYLFRTDAAPSTPS